MSNVTNVLFNFTTDREAQAARDRLIQANPESADYYHTQYTIWHTDYCAKLDALAKARRK